MKKRIQIKEEDYFKYIKTFRIWLKIKKKKHLEDLDKSKLKKKFKKFMKKWNNDKLKDIYYNLDDLQKKYGEQVQHNWNFINQDEKKGTEFEKEFEQLNNEQQISKNSQNLINQERYQDQYDQKNTKGPKLPNLEDKQKNALSKLEEQKNLMLLHDVSADNTYKWENFTISRENRRIMQKQQQQKEINQKLLLHQQKEDEKLKSILDTVNLGQKFNKFN